MHFQINVFSLSFTIENKFRAFWIDILDIGSSIIRSDSKSLLCIDLEFDEEPQEILIEILFFRIYDWIKGE